jgi:multidrug resistance efflux pump
VSAVPSFSRRRWLLLALPLVAGLAVGAHLLNVTLRGDPNAAVATAAAAPEFRPVIAFGHVTVEGGIVQMTPSVPGGRVTEVRVKEGDAVPAGTVLLRLDDAQARAKVTEAKAAVETARAELDRGRSLPEQHKIKLEQAQAAVDAAEAQRNAAQQALDQKERLVRINQLNAEALSIAREELRAAQEGLRIKQADLRQMRLVDPKTELRVLENQVKRAEAVLAQAEAALKEYSLVAPVAGTVLQLVVGVGDTVGAPSAVPAVQFCPDGPRVVKADVEQAFAALVAEGQRVTIEDDTHAAGRWTGRVKRVADWYTQQRPVLQPDPSQYTDVRTMPCVIELDPGQKRLRINQRVRVTIEVPLK